ncbi:hypothetical protein [Tardiphaga sp. vice154]|uniref:hypothetical protein n=1 Tax=Tardiphaga sp. vice154 TaxID=2592814 RepID=UPI001FF05DF7|nr:hypothetical protein [Tardiphaga sp. vice154]
MAIATAIHNGAKNSNAALAATVSSTRFPIEVDGSARVDRRLVRWPIWPAYSSGRTEIVCRFFHRDAGLF